MAYHYNPFWRTQLAIRNFFWNLIFGNRFSVIFGAAFLGVGIWLMASDFENIGRILGWIFFAFAALAFIGGGWSWYKWFKHRNAPQKPATPQPTPAPDAPQEVTK